MKKIVCILAVFLFPFILSASWFYKSNPLMQKLDALTSLTGESWELEAFDDGREVLYLDGVEECVKTPTERGYVLTRDGESEEFSFDGKGRLVSWSDQNVDETLSYDEKGMLTSRRINSKDGTLIELLFYGYGGDGTLLEITSDGRCYLVLDDGLSYKIDDVERNVYLDSPVLLSSDISDGEIDFSFSDDGSFTIESDGKRDYYDSTGVLVRREDGDVLLSYSYIDGILSSVTMERGNERIVRHIDEGGRVDLEDVYLDGELSRTIRLIEDGTFYEVRYADGKGYAYVHYDRDRRRILEAGSL